MKKITSKKTGMVSVSHLKEDDLEELYDIISDEESSYKHLNVEDSDDFQSINGILYNKDATVLLRCPCKKEGHVKVPDSVKTIANDAFIFCEQLTSIELNNGLKNIEESAFMCSGLTDVTIPEGVETIGMNAFNCSFELKNVKLPNSLKKIDFGAFDSCPINVLTIPSSVKEMGTDCLKGTKKIIASEFFSNMLFTFTHTNCVEPYITEVQVEDKHYFIPCTMKTDDIWNLTDIIENGGLDSIEFYKYGMSDKIRRDTAFAQYAYAQTEELRAYLKKKAKAIAKDMIVEGKENDLVKLLKADLLAKGAKKDILKLCEENNMTIAATCLQSK